MTLFEYLAAGHVLILSFAVVRIMNVVPYAARPRCSYWVHLCWLSLAIGFCLVSFWGFWSYRELEWTLPSFIARLIPTALIYTFTSLLAPPNPSAILSWREHFAAIRLPLFITGLLLTSSILFTNWAFLGLSPFQFGTLHALFIVFAVGLASDKPALQNALAVTAPAIVVVTVVIVARPDWVQLQ